MKSYEVLSAYLSSLPKLMLKCRGYVFMKSRLSYIKG